MVLVCPCHVRLRHNLRWAALRSGCIGTLRRRRQRWRRRGRGRGQCRRGEGRWRRAGASRADTVCHRARTPGDCRESRLVRRAIVFSLIGRVRDRSGAHRPLMSRPSSALGVRIELPSVRSTSTSLWHPLNAPTRITGRVSICRQFAYVDHNTPLEVSSDRPLRRSFCSMDKQLSRDQAERSSGASAVRTIDSVGGRLAAFRFSKTTTRHAQAYGIVIPPPPPPPPSGALSSSIVSTMPACRKCFSRRRDPSP